MLTIREPIALRTQKPIQGLRQDMAERMQANYGLMNMSIRKEEMLHVTSEPPEVYFAEGDSLQIFNNIKSENQQEIRLDVINNLINRIMVSQTENFTYQDTVYISSVLRRLGIRDEKLFMKQVFALQNEHKETRQLLENYENHQEVLKKFFLEQKENQKAEPKSEEKILKTDRRYYIHDEIFQRLETGKIYQDMRQFSKGNRHESQQIFRTEMQLGEQATLEQNFLLQDLKQNITHHPTPIYYCHNNQYEYLQEVTENITESLEEQMSAAILLNIVDQSYALRQQQIEENSHYWYSIAGALFQTAENTWKRYEANLMERKFVSDDVLQVLDEVNQIKHLENTTIQNITDAYTKVEESWNTVETVQNQYTQNQRQMNRAEEVNISGGSYHLTQEELELQFLDQAENVENEENAITVEQLQKQLEIFNQQNYANYLKMEEIAKSQPQIKERKLDRKKAQRDALRALENPEEVLKEYLTTEVHDPVVESRKEVETQIYDLFSDETKEIYRQFLLQNQTTEETFLQHIMNQPEEHAIHQDVIQSIHQAEHQNVLNQIKAGRNEYIQNLQNVTADMSNEELRQQIQILNAVQSSKIYDIWTNPEEILLQIEQEENRLVNRIVEQQELIKQKSSTVLTDVSNTISKETTKLLEQLVLIHPEEILEEQESEQIADYKEVLEQLVERDEEITLQSEVQKVLEYVEKQELIRQIHSQIKEQTKNIKSELLEKTNEELKEQVQVLHQLQTSNIYEQWTKPEEVIHQIEKEETILMQRIHKQHESLRQQSELLLRDSSMMLSNETTKLLERLILIHPEEILEEKEIEQISDYKTVLKQLVVQTEERTLQSEVEKALEYIEKQQFFKQIHSQMQVLHELQTSSVYEKWTAPKEVLLQVEKEEKTLIEQIHKQKEMIRQQSEHILKNSDISISNEITKVLEKLTLVHPEEVLEIEGLIQEEEYRTVLQHIMHEAETTELRKEISKLLEYTNQHNIMQQIRQIATAHTEYLQPVVSETVNQKLQQQKFVFEHLQKSNVYEKWTMPADVVWQVEQAEAEVIKESLFRQQNIENHLKRQQTEHRVVLQQTNTEEIFKTIDFVHKVEEQFLNEELLEEIRMQRQTTKNEEHTEVTTLQNKTNHYQTVQETVNHMQTTRLDQIEELVQQSVKRQVGELSDQVYGKIEKKLQTERKRRGYF